MMEKLLFLHLHDDDDAAANWEVAQEPRVAAG